MTAPFTRCERKALAFIRQHIAEHQEAPSYQEIANGVGVKSKGRVSEVVTALVAKGALTRGAGRAHRSIALVHSNAFTVDLPTDLAVVVRNLAARAGVAPEAVLIEALRDGLGTVQAHSASRETSAPATRAA